AASDSADTTLQATIDSNKTATDSAIAGVQSDVDANKAASDSADTTLQTTIDTNKTATDTAIAGVQSDVATNKAASDLAETTLQTDINAVQSDVDSYKTVVQTALDEKASNTDVSLKAPLESPTFTGILTAPAIVKSGGLSSEFLMADGSVVTAGANIIISAGTLSSSGITEVADEYTYVSGTTFTLTQTPSEKSKVKMYVNGIRISNSAYSVIGTTLTYVSANNGAYALSVNDRIQFDYFY
ncbi:hypothetical protein, partial [Flavobacterium sp. XS2P39]|uniref:hypothetical protein n=1 Tax=Flavobacterium sp. XS2P39 TaxID=3401725 RepID=UPI003AB0F3DF